MSETDSFIREVTEEVQKDRMYRRWKKYGPYLIAAIVGIVGASGGLNWYNHYQEQQARGTGGAFLATEGGSVAAGEELVASVSGPAKGLAEMRLAAAKAAEGDIAGAAALYREIAGNAELGAAYTDLARLKAVQVSQGEMDPSEAIAELGPLTAEGAPYRLLAMELRAVVQLNSGAAEAAHADLIAILQDPASTTGLRERAAALLVSSGGTLPELTQ